MTDPKAKQAALDQLRNRRSPTPTSPFSLPFGLLLVLLGGFAAGNAVSRLGSLPTNLPLPVPRSFGFVLDLFGSWPVLALGLGLLASASRLYGFQRPLRAGWTLLALVSGTAALSLLAAAISPGSPAPGAGGHLGALLASPGAGMGLRVLALVVGAIFALTAAYGVFTACGIELPGISGRVLNRPTVDRQTTAAESSRAAEAPQAHGTRPQGFIRRPTAQTKTNAQTPGAAAARSAPAAAGSDPLGALPAAGRGASTPVQQSPGAHLAGPRPVPGRAGSLGAAAGAPAGALFHGTQEFGKAAQSGHLNPAAPTDSQRAGGAAQDPELAAELNSPERSEVRPYVAPAKPAAAVGVVTSGTPDKVHLQSVSFVEVESQDGTFVALEAVKVEAVGIYVPTGRVQELEAEEVEILVDEEEVVDDGEDWEEDDEEEEDEEEEEDGEWQASDEEDLIESEAVLAEADAFDAGYDDDEEEEDDDEDDDDDDEDEDEDEDEDDEEDEDEEDEEEEEDDDDDDDDDEDDDWGEGGVIQVEPRRTTVAASAESPPRSAPKSKPAAVVLPAASLGAAAAASKASPAPQPGLFDDTLSVPAAATVAAAAAPNPMPPVAAPKVTPSRGPKLAPPSPKGAGAKKPAARSPSGVAEPALASGPKSASGEVAAPAPEPSPTPKAPAAAIGSGPKTGVKAAPGQTPGAKGVAPKKAPVTKSAPGSTPPSAPKSVVAAAPEVPKQSAEQAPARRSRTRSKPEPKPVANLGFDPSDRERLVYESGLVFLDSGRVAVSMLQKGFGLDFKTSTEVLDALQDRGLIGPYLGGKSRDILIDRAAWQALAGPR